MRLIAIDLGDKRTGIALGDRITMIASPVACIEVPIQDHNGQRLLDALAKEVRTLIGTERVEVLLGLPINMDGSESPRSKISRVFGQRIADALGLDVVLVDERRTSKAADELMAQTGLTHKQKKARRDAIAAAAIMQVYLDTPEAALGLIECTKPSKA
ncbi:MAG: Holliday junction resolvase RuvX [Phycisphaerales bacterium]|nr:Holliday junction resolvase RuvX [Phycisphaerales bacterium]